MHDNKLINAQNETISWTKYVFQNESIRKVRNESIRKVGTKYSRDQNESIFLFGCRMYRNYRSA